MRLFELFESPVTINLINESVADNFDIVDDKDSPWKIFISKKKIIVPKYTGDKAQFVAQAAHKRTPNLVFFSVSDTSKEEAKQELNNKLQKYWADQKEVNYDLYSRATIDINIDFEREYIQPNVPVWIKVGNNGEFPTLTIASKEFLTYYIDDMQSEGFKKAHSGRNTAGGGYVLPLSKSDMERYKFVPYMRYYAKDEGTDSDGNQLIVLQEFEKTLGKQDKRSLNAPGITVAAQTIKGDVREEQLDEKKKKPKPTSPEKWAQAKAKARSKFEVYPSAYANAWAAKEYKRMGGGWRMGE